MGPMLSIDFGNTYTKVGLRIDADKSGQLLKDASLKWDDMNACVPTVAANFGDSSEWHFGTDVLKFRENTIGLKVYRNWKPRFFDEPSFALSRQAVPSTSSTKALSTIPNGISESVWDTISRTVSPQDLKRIMKELGCADRTEDAVDDEVGATDPFFRELGLGYFRWLLSFVSPGVKRIVGCPLSEIPARISLPSFGSVTGAEVLLSEILTEAGWRVDERVPVLAEPLANAIGTFTEGVNATHRNGSSPHLGIMFANTGLTKLIRNAALFGGRSTAWVLIVDLGGYTADFAMIGIDLTDIDARFSGNSEGKPRLSHVSKPIGVTDLDRRLRELLSEPKQVVLDQIMADPDQQRLESFHRNVFGYQGHHTLRKVKIGETTKEKNAIREMVAAFAEEVSDDAEAFLDMHQYDRIDDLILTGGGSMIPAVRQALCRRLSGYGTSKVHLYMQQGEKPVSSIPSHHLGSFLVRGATAIGGASVYFDFADV
jgi:hypothetical protein